MQVLPTTPGTNYTLGFWLANDTPGGPNQVQVQWNGTIIFNSSFPNSFGYTQLAFANLPATNTGTTLTLLFQNDPGWFGLDDVSVSPSPSPVPEPASLLLLGSGLLALGAKVRTRLGKQKV
jgi:hypothetical protein